jgi:hypothetical protein
MLKVVSFEEKMLAVADAIEFDQVPEIKFSMRSLNTCICAYMHNMYKMDPDNFRLLASHYKDSEEWDKLCYPIRLHHDSQETEKMKDRKLAAEQVRKFARGEPIDRHWLDD